MDKDFDARYRFEIELSDYGRRRCWIITNPVITNQDVGYLRERLQESDPEFRAFILETARLFCAAGEQLNGVEPLDEETRIYCTCPHCGQLMQAN